MTDGAAGRFTATVREGLSGPVVEAVGELDYDNALILRTALHRALAVRPAPPTLVVGLAGLTFCDSSGLNTLLQARIEAARHGTVIHLARPAHAVSRLLEMTGAAQLFPVVQEIPALPHTRAG
ncbi:STAS domain-containing protein [Kitasatospora sp. NPDC057223]|uniref:STAS domain-containing protein n=1 Tax=Kitasatospora sp. NPDC057223 TaxID=3346055 RepID=UPI003627DEAD